MRKIFLLILFFTLFSCVYAHKIAGMQLSVELIQDEKILIKGFNEQVKKTLHGNKIKLISMLNNKVLFEGFLNEGVLNTSVPSVPYWIYMYVGNQDVVIEGIAPTGGFLGVYASKKDRAFFYTLVGSLFFICLAIITLLKRRVKTFIIK